MRLELHSGEFREINLVEETPMNKEIEELEREIIEFGHLSIACADGRKEQLAVINALNDIMDKIRSVVEERDKLNEIMNKIRSVLV